MMRSFFQQRPVASQNVPPNVTAQSDVNLDEEMEAGHSHLRIVNSNAADLVNYLSDHSEEDSDIEADSGEANGTGASSETSSQPILS